MTAKEAEGFSPRTLRVYRWALDRFAAWLDEVGVGNVAAITPQRIRSYTADLQRQDLTAWTVHGYMRPIKTFVRFLYAEEMLATDPMAHVAMPQLGHEALPCFTPEQVKALLEACRTKRETAIVLVLLDTGARAAEFCALKVADFDRRTGQVEIRHGKGRKSRTVFVGAKSKTALMRYLASLGDVKQDAPLFPSRKGGGHLTPTGLLLFCHRLGRRAGVANCHPHTFRRTFATWSLEAGMDVYTLQRLMGHSSLTVLLRYVDSSKRNLQAAHAAHGAVDSIL
jgi:integrase/recombinase XerD